MSKQQGISSPRRQSLVAPSKTASPFVTQLKASKLAEILATLATVVALLLCCLFCAAEAKPNGKLQHQINNRQHGGGGGGGGGTNQNNQHHGKYYGSFVGKLIGHQHNISGEVYAVDEQTLFIKSFTHDGQAQDAYFWSSVSSALPSAEGGFIVPDEKGSTKPLERYSNKDIVLRLPEGRTLREIGWLSIWSRPMKLSVADIMIARQLVIPRPLEISPLSQLAHGVKSGPITIVDAQTFLVPDFHYDGLGPAGYFWLTRGGSGLAANGLRLKDENGNSNPLRKYQGETVVISLPDELTVYDFDYFGVWCKEFQVNFGQTRIPQSARVPPSPKMLGIKPENKLNCEILYDDLGYEIRWVLDGDDIVMQLVGKIEPGEYMAFGLGKDDSKSDMHNADAVVTWVDRPNGQVHAIDYFLGSKAQCVNNPKSGSCPDVKLTNGGDSLTLLHGAIVNGYSMVTFKRPQLGVDELYDQHVYSDGQQSVLWAIGVLNAQREIGYHRLHTKGNMFIDFARNPQWNCPIPDLNASMHNNLPVPSASQMDPTVVSGSNIEAQSQPDGDLVMTTGSLDNRQASGGGGGGDGGSSSQLATQKQQVPAGQSQAVNNINNQNQSPWFIPSIVCPSDRTFFAQIGPTGGPKKGYEGLTGRPSWGVAWYINGLLAPELVLERGQSYKFVVEGGNDKTSTTRRHPLYLTDSQEGGFDFKTDDERQRERIFAGVALRGDGQFVPTAEGRLCELRPTNLTLANPDAYQTFSAYQRTLKLDCLAGQASFLKFVPDVNTPDTIYYQCYTHRYMGWRIKVVDSCQAYVGALARSMSGLPIGGSSTSKRDTRLSMDQTTSSSEHRPTVDRRESGGFSDINMMASLLAASEAPPEMSEGRPGLNNFNFGPDTFQVAGDFGDEVAGSSPFTTELSTIPSDMLIMNASQLMQKQPVNLSMLEQILKFSPNDVEFMDTNGNGNANNNAEYQQTLAALASQFAGFNGNPNNQISAPIEASTGGSSKQQVKVAPSAKSPKGLNSYMKRLASIYYPVQQQLASMLSTSSGGGGASNSQSQSNQAGQHHIQSSSPSPPTPPIPLTSTHQNQQPNDPIPSAPSEQSSSFSLSSLVPKPKIDLSKSNISKKLNKLRIKSGRKYEPNGSAGASGSGGQKQQPPTPANEFNYDIFNNQLAQLEKQQKQLQSLESMQAAIWPQPSSESLNYLPFLTNANDDPRHVYHQQPPTMEDLQSASQMFGGGGNNLLNVDRYPVGETSGSNNNNHIRQPPRTSTIQLGGQTSYGQTPQVTDYFSMIFNTSANRQPQNNHPKGQQQQHHQHQQHQQHQHQPQSSQNAQHAVFITRLPPSELQGYQQHMSHQQEAQHQQRPPWPAPNEIGSSVRYPNIQPYGPQASVHQDPQEHQLGGMYQPQQQYPQTSGMSTMHSSPLSIHESRETLSQLGNHMTSVDPEGESLSGSGSGSHYEFRMQPQQQAAQKGNSNSGSNSEQADHMLAIERFSKQPSERRPPSIVHPITGEQVHYVLTSGPSPLNGESSAAHINYQSSQISNNATNEIEDSRPQRYSNILVDKNIMASSPSPPVVSEMLDADQSVQMTSELRRLNSTPPKTTQFAGDDHNNKRTGSFIPNQSTTTMQQQPTQQVAGNLQMLVQSQPIRVPPQGASTSMPTTTQEPVGSTLVKPNEIYDIYNRQQQQQQHQTSTTTASSVGPLVPSAGPPIMSASHQDGELVLKSTLVEPAIVSTLVQTPSYPPPSSTTTTTTTTTNPFVQQHLFNGQNFDSNPFIPIELSSQPADPSVYYMNSAQHQQFAASHLMANRLRPSPLVESMLSQYSQSGQYKPEPPVQVASYLSQHLAAHGPPIEKMATMSSKPNVVMLNQHQQQPQQQQQKHFHQSSNRTNNPTQEQLIILKPSPLDATKTNRQTNQQTYALKPEYMTNQFKVLNGNNGVIGSNQAENSLYNPNDNSDLLYSSNDIVEPARRLAGHQFERLSSLSSPPSTSIALDPMQVAHSLTSYVKSTATGNHNHNYDERQSVGGFKTATNQQVVASPVKPASNETTTMMTTLSSNTNSTSQTDLEQLNNQHRQTSLLSKPISLTVLQATEGVRKYPGGDNINTLPRDNNTDNAILSHVMSLISSNAIPAPFPFVGHSNADYFMPSAASSDRLFSRSLRRG